jgi:hypothetical protein
VSTSMHAMVRQARSSQTGIPTPGVVELNLPEPPFAFVVPGWRGTRIQWDNSAGASGRGHGLTERCHFFLGAFAALGIRSIWANSPFSCWSIQLSSHPDSVTLEQLERDINGIRGTLLKLFPSVQILGEQDYRRRYMAHH